jgi:hypothetical protein
MDAPKGTILTHEQQLFEMMQQRNCNEFELYQSKRNDSARNGRSFSKTL